MTLQCIHQRQQSCSVTTFSLISHPCLFPLRPASLRPSTIQSFPSSSSPGLSPFLDHPFINSSISVCSITSPDQLIHLSFSSRLLCSSRDRLCVLLCASIPLFRVNICYRPISPVVPWRPCTYAMDDLTARVPFHPSIGSSSRTRCGGLRSCNRESAVNHWRQSTSDRQTYRQVNADI